MKQNEFFSRVYNMVGQIPEGGVMTYGQIAALMGAPNCARRVGQAMFNTPEYLQIPAHRVVNSKGELAPPSVFGGEGIQRKHLEDEGVVFKQNGCIDLKKCIFRAKAAGIFLLPVNFLEKVLRIFPDKGEVWLDELPVLLEEFIQKWKLTDCRVAENLSIQFICYAKSPEYGEVVLKAGVPHLEVFTGMDALKLYNGVYACRLYETDREKGVMLLERIIPGSQLKEEPDFLKRTAAATELVQKLPVEIKGDHNFPHFEGQMNKAFSRVRLENRADEEFISMLAVAERLHERIKSLGRPLMLLHGDLHHENILKDASGAWKVIDPQGRIGPQCLETGRYLLNEWDWFDGPGNTDHMTMCIDSFAASLGESRETIAACAFLDCALSHCWSLEESCGPEVIEEALQLMKYLLGLIKTI